MSEPDIIEGTIRDLIQSYHDFNPAYVPVIDGEPTPLEFARYVSASQPVLIRSQPLFAIAICSCSRLILCPSLCFVRCC